MSPTLALLGYAQTLLNGTGEQRSGQSARLAALIARQALEMMVDDRCAELGAKGCDRATMRSRLTILKSLDNADRAAHYASLWTQLSASCHEHAYDLPPTAAEVRGLCEEVVALAN